MIKKFRIFENDELDPYGEEIWDQPNQSVLHALNLLGDYHNEIAENTWNQKIEMTGSVWHIFGDSEYVIVTDKGVYAFRITEDNCVPDYLGADDNGLDLFIGYDTLYHNHYGVSPDGFSIKPSFKEIFEKSFKDLNVDLTITSVYRKKLVLQ